MFRDLWEDSPLLTILVGAMMLIGLGLVLFVLVMAPISLYRYVVDHDKWKGNCGDHVIVASYAKDETESDPHIINGVTTNGQFTTGTIFVDKDVTSYYVVLDNNTMWKFPKNIGPYVKEGDMANKYCNVDAKYIK